LLLDGSEWSGAYYIVGYAVECGLKACFTKSLFAYHMPDKKEISDAHTHNLASLAQLAEVDGARNLLAQTDSDFALNWKVVSAWKETGRYEIWSEIQAKELYEAVTNVNHGVLPWLRTVW
jgi:hypothetical protein